MPTLIDSLVVSLGLDSRDLTAKTPAATKNLKDVDDAAEGAEKSVKKVSTSSKEASGGLGELTKAAGAFLAVIGGATALKIFISDFIETNAQLKRFSMNIEENASDISAWGQAAEQFGGSASGLQGTLDGLAKQQTQLRLTGESSLIPYLTMLGVSLTNVDGTAKTVTEELADIGNAANAKIPDRLTRNNVLRSMGIDQGTANLLMADRTSRELLIKRIKDQTAVTDKQAESALKLNVEVTRLKQGFAAFGRGLLEQALPMLEKVLGWLTELGDWVRTNSEFVGDFLKVMAVGLGAIAIAAVPIDLVVVGILALATAVALLWQDYQTWKRGGDSLIDWGKWKPEIDAAIAGMEKLAAVAKKTFGFVGGAVSITKDLVNGNKAAAGATLGRMLNRDVSSPEMVKKLEAYNTGPKTGSAAYMQNYFQQRGYTPEQAAGITANLMTESRGNIHAVGDSGHAYGLAQWHEDRQANFKEFSGHDIRLSTLDEQLAFVVHEMAKRGKEERAGDKLRDTTTAAQAGAVVSKYYERPLDTEGNMQSRGAYAQSLAKTNVTGDTSNSVTNSVRVDKIEVHTQATDAPGIVQSMGEAMNYLFTSQANPGLR
jgi:hypothetical protein